MKIGERMLIVAKLGEPSEETVEDPDLTGPICIGILLGTLLLLSGKYHFGDIYAMFVVGNILSYFFFNMMSKVHFYLINIG